MLYTKTFVIAALQLTVYGFLHPAENARHSLQGMVILYQ